MLKSGEDGIQVLESFLKSQESPFEAVLVVERITKSVSETQNVSNRAVELSLKTLATLLKNPVINTLESLLTICEVNRSFQILNVFMLATAACRALVATAVKATEEKSVVPAIAFRIFTCIINNAQIMVQRALLDFSVADAEVLRCFKVARFYCLNAAKCASVFAQNSTEKNDRLLEQVISQCVNALSGSLQLISIVSHAVLVSDNIPQQTHNVLETEIGPSAGTALRSLLFFFSTCFDHDLTKITFILKEALNKIQQRKEQHEGSAGNDAYVNQSVFSIVHLVRLASCNSEDAKQATLSAINTVRTNLNVVILPSLFTGIEKEYGTLVGSCIPGTKTSLIESVVSAIGCLGEMRGYNVVPMIQSITESLLIRVSSPNGACAYVAISTLLTMINSLRITNPELAEKLVSAVVGYTRMSFMLSSPHAETRWLVLAAELLCPYIPDPEKMRQILETSKAFPRYSHIQMSTENDLEMNILSRNLMRFYLDNISQYKDIFEHDKSPRDPTNIIVSAFETDLISLRKETEAALQEIPVSRSIINSSIRLVALLSQGHLNMDGLISVLKQKHIPLSTICTIFNTIEISMLQPPAIMCLIQIASSHLRKYGIGVVPTITSFLSRNCSNLDRSLTPEELSVATSLLEQGIYIAQSQEKHNAVSKLMYSTTLFHCVTILTISMKNPLPINSNQRIIDFLKGTRQVIENYQARLQEWRITGSRGVGSSQNSEEQMDINQEQVFGGESSNLKVNDSSQIVSRYLHSLNVAEANLWELLRLTEKETNGVGSSELHISFRRLQTLLNNLSTVTNKGK